MSARGAELATKAFGAEAPGAPEVWILHGILGSLRNWRMPARRLASARPAWRVVAVDLRNHGDSPAIPGDASIEAVVDDLAALAAARGAGPAVVVGHSYGGKVALACGRRPLPGLRGVVSLDSVASAPGSLPDDNDVAQVFAALEKAPVPFDRREDLVDWMQARGFSQGLAAWMSTNLEREDGSYVWRFDLAGARRMLQGYLDDDLWPWLEHPGVDVELVMAGRGARWAGPDQAIAERLQAAGRLRFTVLEAAGHWVHVDDPEGVQSILAGALDRAG